jgi:putative phage-type endonuclease
MSDIAIHVDQHRAEGMLMGASDAAAALGLDPYRSPLSVWRRLRGLDGDTSEDSEPAKWGRVLEPIVRGEYALRNRAAVMVPVESTTKDGWLRCTPDGLVLVDVLHADIGVFVGSIKRSIPGAGPATDGLVQCKTASAYLSDDWAERPPAKYEIQVRVEMAVTDLPWCDVACLIGGQRYVCFRVHRDAKLEDNILRDLRSAWERARDGVEPDVDASEDWRRHLSERMAKTSASIEARDSLATAVEEWRARRTKIRQLEEEERELKNQLLKALADAGATKILHPEGDVTAMQKAGQTRWKEYALSLGATDDGADKFKGDPGSWYLRAPQKWGKEP